MKIAARTPKTVRDWIGFLQSKVIQYDQRYNRRPHPMAHYANALSKIEADVKPLLGSSDSEALNALVRSMNKRFLPDFPPVKNTTKKILNSR